MHPPAGTAHPINPWLIFPATAIGTLIASLDAGIVVVALPVMARDFGANLSMVQWVLSAFLLSISSLLPLAGRLGEIHSGRRVFLIGMAVFILGTVLCWQSRTLWQLVAARVIQGGAAALIMAMIPAIIMEIFPGKERGRALGLNATIVALGLLAGPGLGGLLIAHFGWPFIFLANVPLGLLGLVLGLWLLPRGRPAGDERLDLTGAGLFAVGMATLLIGVSHGNDWGWGTLPVILCGVVAFMALDAFHCYERLTPFPLVDFGVVGTPRFLLPSLAAMIAYATLYTVNVLMPFYLHQRLHMTPQMMGMMLTVAPAVTLIVAPISGWLSEKLQPSYLSAAGLGLIAVGLVAQLRLDDASEPEHIVLGLVLVGLGFGLFSSPNNNTILSSAPAHKSGLAGGLLALMRNLGMVCGVALATAIFETLNTLATNPLATAGGEQPFYPGFRTALVVAASLAVAASLLSLVRARMGGNDGC